MRNKNPVYVNNNKKVPYNYNNSNNNFQLKKNKY